MDYKLLYNLAELSVNYIDYKEQWIPLKKVHYDTDNHKCACNRSLKNCYFYFNIYNGNTAILGRKCRSHVDKNVSTNSSNNDSLDQNIIINDEPEYSQIEDFNKYSYDNLLDIIKNLFSNNDLENLKDIINKLLNKSIFIIDKFIENHDIVDDKFKELYMNIKQNKYSILIQKVCRKYIAKLNFIKIQFYTKFSILIQKVWRKYILNKKYKLDAEIESESENESETETENENENESYCSMNIYVRQFILRHNPNANVEIEKVINDIYNQFNVSKYYTNDIIELIKNNIEKNRNDINYLRKLLNSICNKDDLKYLLV